MHAGGKIQNSDGCSRTLSTTEGSPLGSSNTATFSSQEMAPLSQEGASGSSQGYPSEVELHSCWICLEEFGSEALLCEHYDSHMTVEHSED